MFIIMPTQFGTGFQVPQIVVPAFMRGTSAVRGQVVEFDFANAQATVTDNNMDGGDNSGFGNVVAITNPTVTSSRKIYGIIEGPNQGTAGAGTTVTQNAEAQVTMYGVTLALEFFAGAIPKDTDLFADPDGSTTALVTAGTLFAAVENPVIAKSLDAQASATPAILTKVWFWGGLPFGIRVI